MAKKFTLLGHVRLQRARLKVRQVPREAVQIGLLIALE